MKQITLALAVVLAIGTGTALAQHTGTTPTVQDGISNAKQTQFSNAMRKLWEDHVTWTRLVIVSAVHDLPDKPATTQRLLQNQVDIGNAIKPYYGDEAGIKLTALLNDHILIAADLVAAAKTNDTSKLESANRRWFENADDIARFLSSANPANWTYEHMRTHMHDHLKLTTEQAVAQLHGDWIGSIRAYDKVHIQILGMADGLTGGIVAQFPEKFR